MGAGKRFTKRQPKQPNKTRQRPKTGTTPRHFGAKSRQTLGTTTTLIGQKHMVLLVRKSPPGASLMRLLSFAFRLFSDNFRRAVFRHDPARACHGPDVRGPRNTYDNAMHTECRVVLLPVASRPGKGQQKYIYQAPGTWCIYIHIRPCISHPPGSIFHARYFHGGNCTGARKVGVRNISSSAFRRRIVRYWNPLGCRAIEPVKPPQWGVIV